MDLFSDNMRVDVLCEDPASLSGEVSKDGEGSLVCDSRSVLLCQEV